MSYCIFTYACISCFADAIYLKNGNKVEGVILQEKQEKVELEIKIGKIVFDKNQIEKIDKWSESENRSLRDKWSSEKDKKPQTPSNQKVKAAKEEDKGKKEDIQPQPVSIVPPKKEADIAQAPPNLYGRTHLRKVNKKSEWSYYIYSPPNYTPSKKWPLFIGVHGSGGDGRGAMEWWRTFAYKEGFILVCPNFRKGYAELGYNTDQQLLDIIEEVKKDFQIDEKKILLAGFSAGAQFAHRFVFRHPDTARAVSLMACGNYDLPDSDKCKKVKDIKFLVMVGDNDDQKRRKSTELFAERLKEHGCNVQYQTFPFIGHTMEGEAIRLTIKLLKEL